MKLIYKISTIFFGIGLLISTNSNAQEFKTNESISSQLKKGTVSGLKFSAVVPNAQRLQVEEVKVPQYTKGNFKAYLQQQSQVAAGGGIPQTRAVQQTLKAQSAPVPLASDSKLITEKSVVPEKISAPEKP